MAQEKESSEVAEAVVAQDEQAEAKAGGMYELTDHRRVLHSIPIAAPPQHPRIYGCSHQASVVTCAILLKKPVTRDAAFDFSVIRNLAAPPVPSHRQH